MFKRILVPVDGSTPSKRAVSMAISLAQEKQGQVRLVHVLEQAAFMTGYDPSTAASGHLYGALLSSGEQVLQEAAGTVRAAGLHPEVELVQDMGRLGDAVATACTSWAADLVVVGTHGRRGPSRLLLGSGAEQIIRFATVPVLVVRAEDEED